LTIKNEGSVQLQFIYASDLSTVLHEHSIYANNDHSYITVNLLDSLAKLGYKLTPLSQKDFDTTDGHSIVHKAHEHAVKELFSKAHMKYQDYLNMLPEDVFDKDEPMTEPQEHIFHISRKLRKKQLDYQAKVINTFVEDINSYKNLNKGSS